MTKVFPGEREHLVLLRKTSNIIEELVRLSLRDIILLWPSDPARTDERSPLYTPQNPVDRARQAVVTGPLATRRPRLISSMSDAELRRLWPSIPPGDVRRFAPWATSYQEVARIAWPTGIEMPTPPDLEERVRAGIKAARVAPPGPEPVFGPGGPKGPQAFRSRLLPREQIEMIFDATGRPLVPPATTTVSQASIDASREWAEEAMGIVLRPENLALPTSIVADNVRRGAERVARVPIINLRQEIPGMGELMDSFVRTNAELIQDVAKQTTEQIYEVVSRAHEAGLRVEVIAGELEERFGVSKSRAELIARDQVLKLNGQVNQARQQAVGITHYRWKATMDARTRKRHAQLHNTVQQWSSPPEVAPGRHEHPGGDYQCRCTAEPILDEEENYGNIDD